jgi:hypothetical protein
MVNEEITKLIEVTARRTATIVVKQLIGMNTGGVNFVGVNSSGGDDLCDTREAARLLGLTPNYLRSMKDKFPHVKVGDNRQGRILFKRSELLTNYTK